MRIVDFCFAAGLLLLAVGCREGSETARIGEALQGSLDSATVEISAAQRSLDPRSVDAAVKTAVALLGDQAGLPDVSDQYRHVPNLALRLQRREIPDGFEPYIEWIETRRWWRIGIDPTGTRHPLRELADVIEGCLAGRNLGGGKDKYLLALAEEAGKFLLWAQAQGESGGFPFPAVRGGVGADFESAERFLRRAEQEGRLDRVIRNGWLVEDFGDGALQFDNGLAGNVMVDLFEATASEDYRNAAVAAADWAMARPVAVDWNHNSASVLLLARVYAMTGNDKYLEAGVRKATLGVIPGQLAQGPRAGRWFDPHNARPDNHYVMVRALAALVGTMPTNHPARSKVVGAIRLALSARNPEFATRGIVALDQAIVALVEVSALPTEIQTQFNDTHTAEALLLLERYSAHAIRTGRGPPGPGAWGALLKHRHANPHGPRTGQPADTL